MPGRPIVIIGEYYDPTLSIGGGPIYPPSGGGSPPGIWGGGNVPMPTPPIPIYPGGTPNPPGIWGGGNVPMPTPPIPIYPGGSPTPPGIWGGGNVPMPTPPIPIYPGGTPNPPGIWGGGNVPMPTPPIYIPIEPGGGQGQPSQPINEPPTDSPYWQLVYIPQMGGWVWAVVPPPGWKPGQGGQQPPEGEGGSSPSR